MTEPSPPGTFDRNSLPHKTWFDPLEKRDTRKNSNPQPHSVKNKARKNRQNLQFLGRLKKNFTLSRSLDNYKKWGGQVLIVQLPLFYPKSMGRWNWNSPLQHTPRKKAQINISLTNLWRITDFSPPPHLSNPFGEREDGRKKKDRVIQNTDITQVYSTVSR